MRILQIKEGNRRPPTEETKVTYTITSIKHKEQIDGTESDAIARAREINEEYQPACGVQVEDENGNTVWDSEE